MRISLVIPTFKRRERLAALLQDIRAQQLQPQEVVIVDNDADGSARAAVAAALADEPGYPIRYAIQPVKNISITRNMTVELSSCEWIAMIDDDERAPPDWLRLLAEAATAQNADAIIGPVLPQLPATAPRWIAKGRFYDFPRMRSGTLVPPNQLRIGNLLVRAAALKDLPQWFDPDLGLTGGEDGDLLARMRLQGARIVWCDEAVVREPVEERRLRLKWILMRGLRGGQDFARHTLKGRYGPVTLRRRTVLLGRAALQLIVAAALVVVSLPLGWHHAAAWLVKVWANAGKISVVFGLHYREYA
jgi:succinoglycan biosynthesis protein ExoM